jgi:hypothetical protein
MDFLVVAAIAACYVDMVAVTERCAGRYVAGETRRRWARGRIYLGDPSAGVGRPRQGVAIQPCEPTSWAPDARVIRAA